LTMRHTRTPEADGRFYGRHFITCVTVVILKGTAHNRSQLDISCVLYTQLCFTSVNKDFHNLCYRYGWAMASDMVNKQLDREGMIRTGNCR